MSSCNDLIFPTPDQTSQWQETSRYVDHGPRRLVRGTGIDHRHATVMSGKSQGTSTGREGNTMHPSSRIVEKLSTHRVEGKTLTPSTGFRTSINALDVAGKHASVGISRPRCQQNRVWMPGQRRDGASDRFLQVLGYPPVILLLKVANGDDAGSRSDGEFLLRR